MRRVMGTLLATLMLSSIAAPCFAVTAAIGPGRPIGATEFEHQLRYNPELRTFVVRRGYPDWVEEVEVDSLLPLDSHELRLYYLRLDREVSFSRAFILGQPSMTLRLFDRPIPPAMRTRIEEAYLAKDPARRSEMAADRAMAAALQAERAAVATERLAVESEEFAARMERESEKRPVHRRRHK